MHSEIPHVPLPNAVGKHEKKTKLFIERYKKKPRDAKSNKKGATKRISLVLLHGKNDIKRIKCFKTLLHAKSDISRNEHLRIFLHGKSEIKTATSMKNSATASSSSPCPSSLEAMIPKSISHGP